MCFVRGVACGLKKFLVQMKKVTTLSASFACYVNLLFKKIVDSSAESHVRVQLKLHSGNFESDGGYGDFKLQGVIDHFVSRNLNVWKPLDKKFCAKNQTLGTSNMIQILIV